VIDIQDKSFSPKLEKKDKGNWVIAVLLLLDAELWGPLLHLPWCVLAWAESGL
jgi:hypothetical protein